MLKTLQLYITRELLKTFALTAIGLTLTFSLCGGVLNMIQAEVLTAVQVVRILAFIFPLALTLTLPVSAMFACAIVYGRFAADNEVDACKASGINVYRLFAPAAALSIATAAFTFVFVNFVLPQFVAKLDALVRKDLGKIVMSALSTQGHLKKGPYVLFSREAKSSGEENERKVVQINGAAFMEMENDALRSCGTADEVQINFFPSPRPGGNPMVEASMFNVRGLDLKRDQFYHEDEQPIRAIEIPSMLKAKPQWLTLSQLMYYREHLELMPTMREHLENLRGQVREAMAYSYIVNHLAGGPIQLQDKNRTYQIRAERAELSRADYRPELLNVKVAELTPDGRRRDYQAERCSVRLKSGATPNSYILQIVLRGEASFRDSRDPNHKVERKEIPLDEVAAPSEILAKVDKLTDRQLLGLPEVSAGKTNAVEIIKTEPEPMGLGQRVENGRIATRKGVGEIGLKIESNIHARLAFCASVLVTLVLAAALGIIFRGGQLLTAFVISFVPGLLVVVMIIMGRQLMENPGMTLAGVITLWSGIGTVALANVTVMTRFLRR
jgi:lipopolysaccharide export LptBFGC system permease protein LptF